MDNTTAMNLSKVDIWKLNNSLLENKLLANKIKYKMLILFQTCACTCYHPDFVAQY